MSAINTVQTLNGHFKESYAPNILDLVPEGVKLLKMVSFNNSEKQPGGFYNQPVCLSLEHGFSYGGSEGIAFGLQSSIASTNENARVRGSELVLISTLSVAAAARSMSSKNSFVRETKRLVENMLKSMHIRMEIQLMYGQSGIAKVKSVAGQTISICDAEWAAGIFSGSTKAAIEIRSQSGVLRGSANIVKPDLSLKSIEVDMVPVGVTGNADPDNAAADVIWFKGSYGKEFAGLYKIITNTGTLFEINAAEYDLFKGNVYNVGTDAVAGADFISFEDVEQSINLSMEKGLADEDLTLLCNPKHWTKLMTDQAAKRQYDDSYDRKKAENGFGSITFHSQNGKIEIVSSLFCKEGHAFLFPEKELERIGSTDITFEMPGYEGQFFRLLETVNGYELRCYTDQALFTAAPGMFTLLRYIKTA